MDEDVTATFDGRLILKLKEFKVPGKNLRNILIVFLTLLHEELVDLINESEEVEEDEEESDKEWSTIKCFFRSEMQAIALIRSIKGLIESRRITEEYFKKGAAIYEVVVVSDCQTFVTSAEEERSEDEKKVCNEFSRLIKHIYKIENDISGIDYLQQMSKNNSPVPPPKRNSLEVIYEIDNSAMVDVSQ